MTTSTIVFIYLFIYLFIQTMRNNEFVEISAVIVEINSAS